MNNKFAKIAVCISFIFPVLAIDDPETPTLHRYDTIRDLLAVYNQHREDRSKDFGKSTWDETPQLPDNLVAVLKDHSKNSEFSTVAATQPLFARIKPGNIVTDVETLEGGFVSGKIYRVTTYSTKLSREQRFYIKYLRTKPVLVSKGRVLGEQINLDNLAKSPLLEEVEQQFNIMLPIAAYRYDKKIFMVIPSAAGESFTSLVKKDLGPTVDLAFSAMGKALGNLHVRIRHFAGHGSPKTLEDFINVTVVSHGDLHGDNVFYDRSTGKLSLIDTETMANSIDANGIPNSPIFYDMFYMLLMSSKKFGDYMKKNNWRPFLDMFKAYVSAYPADERKGIYDYLIYCLENIKNIKFTDLFENFKLQKGFGSGRIEGAKLLASELEDMRRTLYPETSQRRNFADKIAPRPSQDDLSPERVKRIIEQRYSPPEQQSPVQASSSAPQSAPVIEPAPAEPSVSDQQIEAMSIQPGNMRNLKAFWENQAAKNVAADAKSRSNPR